MKFRYIGLFLLLFLGYIDVSGQELLLEEVDADAIQAFNPAVDLTEREALVIIKSICPFTFSSNVDKTENIIILKTEQQDVFYYYALKFSVPSRARRLRLISDDYEAITYPMDLQPREIKRLIITDPFVDSPFKESLKDGMTFFDQGKYEQAKEKFEEALALAIDRKENEETTALIGKTSLCIEYKDRADQFFSDEEWCAASEEYEKVIGANQLDPYCKEKYETSQEKCMNSTRIISGTVTNLQGKPLSGVSIVIEEQETDNRGKVKYFWSKKVVKTGTDGKFQVEAIMKTRKLQYWKFNFKKYEVGITNDEVDIVINDGSGEGAFGSSNTGSSVRNNGNDNSENTKSSTTSTTTRTKKKSALSK